MTHRSGKKFFSRDASHRKALFKNLCLSLIKHKQIKTTVAKAKYLRGYIEPLITKARNNPEALSTRRYLIAKLGNKEAIEILLKDLSKVYQSRPGGYVRILKIGKCRSGDSAPMAYVQLIDTF
ncbi:MAG: 50S ribosomal protein L17 [Pseudomonadota bacterium]|nr:50S ribosomal protein L17 [Pseudomonadota bacterium]